MTTFDDLAQPYDLGRVGYANDVYNALVEYGVAQKHAILDIGCGTGLASGPLVANGYRVTGVDPSQPMLEHAKRRFSDASWVVGDAEHLPFDDRTFDVAISAHVFHRVDRAAGIREIRRVLRPGGIVAIWWKHLMAGDAITLLRERVARDLGMQPSSSGLTGGFKEFYAASWSDTSLRVIPWRIAMPLSKYLQYERSRRSIRDEPGAKADGYLAALEAGLRETHGNGDPTVSLSYMHYLYLAKN